MPTFRSRLPRIGRSVASLIVLAALLAATRPHEADARGTVLADFESGTVELYSYSDQDQQPDEWGLVEEGTWQGSAWSLLLHGNTWKLQPIEAYPIDASTVLQVAVRAAGVGEMQAFGITDSVNTLFYTLAGSQLPTGEEWEVTYQGAFPDGPWTVYRLPVGRDWQTRFGSLPSITGLVYVNDEDDTDEGVTLFDAILDVTADLPVAPQAEIVTGRSKSTALGGGWFRVGVQFQAEVFDPDSDDFTYAWDFGDSAFSAEADPFHEFLVQAEHTYTVGLAVRDETGLWGRDSAQVTVEPGASGGPWRMNFVGDVMLARGYESPGGIIPTQGVEAIFEPTRSLFGEAAEINVCNLESPLTDEGEPHPTKSYVFRGRPENVSGLVYAGVDVVSLGNNHIVDFGQRGMEETQEVLDAAGIRWSGAGDDEYFARQPVLWTEHGVAVAFIGQCNRTGREWNYQPFLDAAANKPGFSYLIEPNLSTTIAEARPLADLVVVQIHAGQEYSTGPGTLAGGGSSAPTIEDGGAARAGEIGVGYDVGSASAIHAIHAVHDVHDVHDAYDLHDASGEEPIPDAVLADPSLRFPTRPALSDRALRWRAVEAGADLVICHHPHVLQGFEVRSGVLIAHSLGNFAFDQSFAETFPSIVLSTVFDKDGFHAFTFRPVFIDDKIPRPASGRLGREILDRMAEYSRELGTVVSVSPSSMEARIHLDPGTVHWTPETVARSVPLEERDGVWISEPIERTGDGVLSAVVSLDAPGTVAWRAGREILWHGDFEEEGATLWNLNSGDEVYDETVAWQGARSLRQHRTPGNQGPVRTDLEGYPVTNGGQAYSLTGWIRTENAADARVSARLFTGRGSGLLGEFGAGDPISGTTGWTFRWSDFDTPQDAWFFNCRPQMEKPESGDAWAWFDAIRLIEWGSWQDGPLPTEVPYPSNLRFLQVRTDAPADSAILVWEESIFGAPVDAADPPPPARTEASLSLTRIEPNPFNDRTRIGYSLTRPGRVRLAVYDVAGRRVAVLADGERPAGMHEAIWPADREPSGLYFVRLEAGGEVRTRKVVVLR